MTIQLDPVALAAAEDKAMEVTKREVPREFAEMVPKNLVHNVTEATVRAYLEAVS